MSKIFCLLVYIVILQQIKGKLTNKAPLRLCCDVDAYFDLSIASCLPSNQTLLPTIYNQDGSFVEEGFSIMNVTMMNTCDSYQLQDGQFKLLTDGSAIVGSKDESKIYTVNPDNHCLLWTEVNGQYSLSSLICFPEQKTSSNQFYHITHGYILPIGMGISAIFLLATFILYCLVSELRDQLGKSFMCSIVCLCLSNVLAIIIKTSSSELPNWLCIFCGLAMHYCFLQAFFWLNVISILVFTSLWLRGNKFCLESKNGFIVSWIYALGFPSLILLVTMLHDFSTALDNLPIPTPGFGVGSCWFSDQRAQLFYFYAPIAILVGINVILFGLSACKLFILSSTTNSFHFKQYLKLFVLMGISWIFEVLSFFLADNSVPSISSYIWFALDLFNALSGVFIFFFLACRRSVLSRAYARIRGNAYTNRYAVSCTADELSRNDGTNQGVKLVESDHSQRIEA